MVEFVTYKHVYIYIYTIVLKTHLLSKIFSLSLQKLRRYDRNLRKHETKINTAINKTN